MDNVKLLKRQLIAAIFMVLIAATAFISSTYAWYSNIVKVTAKDMSIVALADGISFEITLPDSTTGVAPTDDTWPEGQTVVSSNLPKASLYPVHPVMNNVYSIDAPAKWWHAFSSDFDDADVAAEQSELDVSVSDSLLSNSEGGSYALVATYYVRLNPRTSQPGLIMSEIKAKNVQITCENSVDFIKCARILVAGPDGAEILENGANGTQVLINSIDYQGEPARIDVYAYFEGTDVNCKSSIYDSSDVLISLDFEGISID